MTGDRKETKEGLGALPDLDCNGPEKFREEATGGCPYKYRQMVLPNTLYGEMIFDRTGWKCTPK